jgi:hypothetical protein
MLTVVNGGGGEPPEEPFRKHWLAEHLFKAVSTKPYPDSYMEIHKRMLRSIKPRYIGLEQVGSILNHVRSNAEGYEWTVNYPVRGSSSRFSKFFFPILLDKDDPDFVLCDTPELEECFRAGAGSTARTLISWSRNFAVTMECCAPAFGSRRLRRSARDAASGLRNIALILETAFKGI